MNAAHLIRYKKMILNELGFFLDVSSFSQDLHPHPRPRDPHCHIEQLLR